MKPALVFVHGLANGPEDRRKIPAVMERHLRAAGIWDLLCQFDVATWRSRGAWTTDLLDLGHPDGIRATEAMQDVQRVIGLQPAEAPMIVVGHSMGQVLARMALQMPLGRPAFLVTAGGPLGHPGLRETVLGQKWAASCGGQCPVPWEDVWNREDPICADILMGYRIPTGAIQATQITVPGTPSISNPLAEHSGYFGSAAFWERVRTRVLELDGVVKP